VKNLKFQYVGPYSPKAHRKDKESLLSQRETNQPSINTAMTVAEPVRRFGNFGNSTRRARWNDGGNI